MIGEDLMVPSSETDQLRQQLLQAQKLSSVGALASSVAHEFNNILTTIINYARLALRNPGDEVVGWSGGSVVNHQTTKPPNHLERPGGDPNDRRGVDGS